MIKMAKVHNNEKCLKYAEIAENFLENQKSEEIAVSC